MKFVPSCPDGPECPGNGLNNAVDAMCFPKLVMASPLALMSLPLAEISLPPPLISCPLMAITPPLIAFTACKSVLRMDFFKVQKSNDLWSC